MRETKHFKRGTHQRIAIRLMAIVMLLSAFALAESGTVNLIFDNAMVVQDMNNVSRFEFDVKGYLSNGSDVVAEGMVYVKYPTSIFGDLAVYNQKVVVSKTGILAETDPFINSDLYRIVNITDTYSDVFAITFGLNFDQPEMKPYYSLMSSDANNPSDLFHVSMEVTHNGSGSVLYPDYIPGLNSLYYDYEGEVFDGGLNISDANVSIEFGNSDPGTDPGTDPGNDPIFSGHVNVSRFMARHKKMTTELYWRSENESDISEYMIERSFNGGDFIELAVVPYETLKGKFNSYAYEDLLTEPEGHYTYQLYASDINGVKLLVSTTDLTVSSNKKAILDDGTFTLEASYPNPFNPSFTVPFSVYTSQNVDIKLYDLNGKLVQIVADGYYTPGNYEIRVNGDHLVSGVYLLRTQVNEQQAIQKMLLTK